MPRQQLPPVGGDVTGLMPGVGEDVTALMGGSATPPGASSGAQTAEKPSTGRSLLDTFLEGAKGVVKSGLGVIEGGGEVIRSIPGVGPLLASGPEVTLPVSTKPSNTAQAVGKTVGDIGQFFIPGVGTGGRLVRGAKAAVLTAAQTGGDPMASGASGIITAALPGAGAARRAAGALDDSAEAMMARAMGPTKEATKVKAEKIVPEMIERGVRGSRPQMLAQAEAKLKDVGAKLGANIDTAGKLGVTVPSTPVRKAIEEAAESLAVFDASGVAKPIPGTERVLKRLAKLDEFVASLGDDIPIDKAVKVRRVWDQLVSKAGLYGQKVGASATDSAEAWATREAASAFRELINKGNLTREALNQEYAFWKGVRDVLKETERRTTGQQGGLSAGIASTVGAGVGAATGDSVMDRVQNAALGGIAGKNIIKLLNSPSWLTRVSVPMRSMLADALASGNAARIESAAKAILSATPAQVAQ